MQQSRDLPTHDKYKELANMLDETGHPRLAKYVRAYRDPNIIKSCVSSIISGASPERIETIMFQLQEIGVIN